MPSTPLIHPVPKLARAPRRQRRAPAIVRRWDEARDASCGWQYQPVPFPLCKASAELNRRKACSTGWRIAAPATMSPPCVIAHCIRSCRHRAESRTRRMARRGGGGEREGGEGGNGRPRSRRSWLHAGRQRRLSPDYGYRLAEVIAEGTAEFGIGLCGSGIGISMSANRHPQVRCALVSEPLSAALAREHNDANCTQWVPVS